jgi:hypothetical protein
VVVDTLTKSAHFIPMHMTYQAPDIARVFVSEIVRLHGVPRRSYPIEDQCLLDDFGLVSKRPWEQLNFSTTYHPRQMEKLKGTNQILEDMLHMYVMDQHKHWEDFFPLVEFAYNNSYQSTIKMAPFEFLYGDHVRRR